MKRKKNPSSPPADIEDGIEKFEEFHQLPHKKIGKLGVSIPKTIGVAGDMLWVAYRSSKWHKSGKKENYIHDHEGGVVCYRPDVKKKRVNVPQWIQDVETLVYLGDCLGFTYENEDEDEVEAAVRTPYPKLYCTPDGQALIVVDGNRLVALIWGGFLDVQSRGIVN